MRLKSLSRLNAFSMRDGLLHLVPRDRAISAKQVALLQKTVALLQKSAIPDRTGSVAVGI
jgi:hypothetical protein